jgi:Xaa-Pro dipeptidase
VDHRAADHRAAAAAREERRAKIAARLREEGIAACMFRDAEGARDPTVRYLSGQPGDAVLVIAADGRSILAAWDLNMAQALATVDSVVADAEFKRLPRFVLAGCLERLGVPAGSKVELPSNTSYPAYLDFVETLEAYDLLCRSGGIDEYAQELRGVKDPAELAVYRRVSAITDGLMDAIEAAVRAGSISTELDVALLIERECRAHGCEGTGFETLAAGPARSFGIHAFPPFGAGAFACPHAQAGKAGLSILDFGLKLEGYTSDVTMTFVRGKPDARQERMLSLVREAYDATVAMCAPGVPTLDIARKATGIFSAAGMTMPHALGHGVGLEAHEAPTIRDREDNTAVLRAGQVVTIEPGLYDPELGGVRLEDDILITESGHEVLTHSRIVRL